MEPFLKWFHINRADLFTLTKQIGHEMAANESAPPTDHDFFRFHFEIQHPNEPGTYRESAWLQPVANYTPLPEAGGPNSQSRRR